MKILIALAALPSAAFVASIVAKIALHVTTNPHLLDALTIGK